MKNDGVFSVLPNCLGESDQTNRVAWYEGVQLLPQHFQCVDQCVDHLLFRNAQGCSPYHWGLDTLVYDPMALAAGKLIIHQASGQFRDGGIFNFRSGRQDVLEYDFSSLPIGDSIRLAITLPSRDYRDGRVVNRRFHQYVGDPVPDANNPDDLAVIARLRANLKIQRWERESGPSVELPLIEIRAVGDTFECTNFHPPAVRLMHSSPLWVQAVETCLAIRRSAESLKGPRVTSPLPTEFHVGREWLLSCLLRSLLTLENLLADPVAHPREIHHALCDAYGSVHAFCGTVPSPAPIYCHDDPGYSIAFLSEAIVSVIPPMEERKADWMEIPFSEFADGVFRAALPNGHRSNRVWILLNVSSVDTENCVCDWLRTVLITTDDRVAQCRKARIKGFSRTEISRVDDFSFAMTSMQRMFVLDLGHRSLDAKETSIVIEAPPLKVRGNFQSLKLLVKNE